MRSPRCALRNGGIGESQSTADVVAEGLRRPDRTRREEAGKNGLRTDGRSAKGAARDDGSRGAAEDADGSGFFGGVAEELLGDGGLDFEDGVDAFGGQVESGFVREEGRGIEVVEDRNIDLARAAR